jgi:NADH-quinone oxidoreductase subunit C
VRPPIPQTAPARCPGDGLREQVIDLLRAELGEALVDSHLIPQTDLWVRVDRSCVAADRRGAYARPASITSAFCRRWTGCRLLTAAVKTIPPDPPPERSTEIVQGYAGGETRFQMLARLTDTRRHLGVTIKCDVPTEDLVVDSWVQVFAGANWHERETHEMFGIGFAGHPDLRNMYLPGDFEGYPLRKDFPLLARMVKPWPGIVDVEPMPVTEDEAATPDGDES